MIAPTKPVWLPFVAGDVPEELKNHSQWVVWAGEYRADKYGSGERTKVPSSARTGERASSTDPSTWATWEEAASACQSGKAAGPGFVFSASDDYAGVDLDKCRDPNDGQIESWAAAIIDRLDSYTEISPSGTGVKIFLKGQLPVGGRRRTGGVEMYDSGRYFTVTGHHLEGTPVDVEERHAELNALHAELFPPEQHSYRLAATNSLVSLSDNELIQKSHQRKERREVSTLVDRRHWRVRLAK